MNNVFKKTICLIWGHTYDYVHINKIKCKRCGKIIIRAPYTSKRKFIFDGQENKGEK